MQLIKQLSRRPKVMVQNTLSSRETTTKILMLSFLIIFMRIVIVGVRATFAQTKNFLSRIGRVLLQRIYLFHFSSTISHLTRHL